MMRMILIMAAIAVFYPLLRRILESKVPYRTGYSDQAFDAGGNNNKENSARRRGDIDLVCDDKTGIYQAKDNKA